MRAIILAAGRGSRMEQMTDTLPKCMLPLHGKPLLHHQIHALQAIGITEISVVCGYAKEKIMPPSAVTFFENENWQHSNMVRSLLSASSWLMTSPCIISYSDIFYDAAAVEVLRDSNADITLTYSTRFESLWSSRFTDPLADLETFRFHGDVLTEIGQRPQSFAEVQGQYMGLLKFTPTGFEQMRSVLSELLDEEINRLDMTSLLARLLKAGITINTVAYTGEWGEVDQQSDLALYENTESLCSNSN